MRATLPLKSPTVDLISAIAIFMLLINHRLSAELVKTKICPDSHAGWRLGQPARRRPVPEPRVPVRTSRVRVRQHRDRLDAAIHTVEEERRAQRSDAALPQDALLWGVRLRLGMGRRLLPPRRRVL